MKRRYLFLLATLAFAVTLVLHAPANLVHAWTLGRDPGPTRVHGLHGTLAAGGFAALTVHDRPVLTETRWRLHPLWLVLLRVTADLESSGDTIVRARVSRAVLGTLRLSEVQAAGSVRGLLSLLGQGSLPVEGQVRLDLPFVRLDEGVPIEVDGTAELQNLVWTMARAPLPLGGFSATFSTDDKGVLITLESGSGPVELAGTVTIGPDRAYETRLQLRPRAEATAPVQSLVRSLGQPDAQGWYHLRRSGSL